MMGFSFCEFHSSFFYHLSKIISPQPTGEDYLGKYTPLKFELFHMKSMEMINAYKNFAFTALGCFLHIPRLPSQFWTEPSRPSPSLNYIFNQFRRSLILQSVKQSSSDPVFFIFYPCGKSTFETTIKTKTTHYFDKRTTHFVIRVALGTFLFHKNISFSF